MISTNYLLFHISRKTALLFLALQFVETNDEWGYAYVSLCRHRIPTGLIGWPSCEVERANWLHIS